MTFRLQHLSLILLFITASCSENPVDVGVAPPSPVLPFYYDNPAWHPDGKWIAADHGDSIDSNYDGIVDTVFSGIWIVNAETGYKQPLIRGFSLPDWSPDGKRLTAVSGAQIFIMEVSSLEPALIDTNSITQLTFEGRNFFPAWSPDGNWIAYSYSICGGDSTCGTWLMDTAGNRNRFLFLHGVEYSWHSLDPLILYASRVYDQSGSGLGDLLGVFDIRANSDSSIRFLSEPNHDNQGPKYSPDGRGIAISSQPRGGSHAIWIMDSDGGNLRQLTEGPDLRFDWSPDGSQIVFLRWSHGEPIEGNGQLWVINTDGSNLRQLTYNK